MLKRKPNLPNASSRRCLVCGFEKPLTVDNFQIVPSFANGFSFYSRAIYLIFVDEAESVDEGQNS